ncbi:MAG: hypothetical protein WAW00_03310 [Candidatus Moraniibacteriota bacterium]
MGIEDLNEKLHGRDIHLGRAERHTPFDPGRGAGDSNAPSQFQKTEAWQQPVVKPSLIQRFSLADVETRRRRKNIAIVIGSIAGLILLGGLIFKVRSMLFSEERVAVSIAGPKDVASAEETTFTITYANDNWAGLNDATLVLVYPESFRLQAGSTVRVNGALAEIPLGGIKANTQGKVPITGKFYGSKGDLVYFKATLRYTPKGVSSIFEKTVEFGVNVASSALSFEITAPLELATGQDVEYVIDYGNKSDEQFSNLRVKLEYPSGFHFVGADPKPSEGDSVWYLGNFKARADGKIIVRGVLSGVREERKLIRGMIGFFQGDGTFVAYAENERQTRIMASPLSISQMVNELTDIAVNPGDTLRYVIRYKNDGTIGVRDAIVTLEIDPSFLDVGRLSLLSGAYDAARKTIVWKASDIPGLGRLEPGASGEITFSVPTTKTFTATSGKDIAIRSVAKIDSPDIPTPIGANKIIGSNTLYVKLNALVGIGIKPLYTDMTFVNSGPVPPQVGKETSYTVHLNITNSSNDIRQSRVSVILPTGIRYGGKFFPTGETLAFNERTNELTWELGTFAATRDTPRALAFQISAVPGSNQEGRPLALIKNITFTGQDAFTGQDIRVESGERDNYLRDDKVYGSASSDVEPALVP